MPAQTAEINGRAGFVLTYRAGGPLGVLVLDIDETASRPIAGIRIVVNTDRLSGLTSS